VLLTFLIIISESNVFLNRVTKTQLMLCLTTAIDYCLFAGTTVWKEHIKVTEFARDKYCLVCGPGTLVELDTSSTLSDVSANAKTS
jgi:hypothetical protein